MTAKVVQMAADSVTLETLKSLLVPDKSKQTATPSLFCSPFKSRVLSCVKISISSCCFKSPYVVMQFTEK